MKYAQAGRVELLEQTGLMNSYAEVRKGPIIASIKCQFIRPLFYPGTVTVYSKVEAIRNTSFELHHLIYNDKGEAIAEGHDIMVFFDFNKDTKMQIPADIREKLEKMMCGKTE
jgi:acyl-CoA thioester hydrolase